MKKHIKLAAVVLALLIGSNTMAAEEPNYKLGVGPSLGLLNSIAGFGATVNVLTGGLFPEVPDLHLGVESGFYYWSSAGGSVTSFPILPMVMYKLPLPKTKMLAYLGVAMGVSVTTGSSGTGLPGTTQAQFEMLFKPGIEVSSFFIEPKFGTLNGTFVFLPTVGYYFPL